MVIRVTGAHINDTFIYNAQTFEIKKIPIIAFIKNANLFLIEEKN
jgi:hypothetical protein